MKQLPEDSLAAARRAAETPVFIRDGDMLEKAAATWLEAGTIGLDTEFVRERTFYAQPGLVQLSDGDTVWLLDPLAVSDMSPLRTLLEHPGIDKVLHSAGEDLEVLYQLTGAFPDPLFDTQIAAALIGRPMQLAYERLVEDTLGEDLPGGKARSNWLQRPLPSELLGYAAQDVAYLPMLMKKLAEALEARGRLEWLEEDCNRILDAARNPPGDEESWSRIKGATSLEEDDARYRLIRLAAWREREAIRRDRPRRFMLKDEVLLEIARRGPHDIDVLRAVPGMPDAIVRRHADEVLECARLTAPADFVRPPGFEKLDNGQREKLRKLQQHVRRAAEKLEIEAPVLASKRELVNWLQEETPDWPDGWRGRYLTPVC